MTFPEDLKYTKDHEWVRFEGDIATVGITEYAQGELGDIVYVEIETEGEDLNEHDVFGSVEAVKTVSDLYMPLPGTVIEINEQLSDTPEVVNNDPYGEGWMIKVKVYDPGELGDLMDFDGYTDFVEKEMDFQGNRLF